MHPNQKGLPQEVDRSITLAKYTELWLQTIAPGKLAPAASAEASGEYAATYFATYIDGKKVLEIDIINFIYYVNGTDYLADVRKALGKA